MIPKECGRSAEADLPGLNSSEDPVDLFPTSPVCHLCLRHRQLATKVMEEGVVGLCAYCGETCEALTVDALIARRPNLPVCYSCIEDTELADEVKAEGAVASCSYCGETREAITWETLIVRPMVCHVCIGDRFLTGEVKEGGVTRPCKYCGETREAIALNTLAVRVDETLQEHFTLTPEDPVEPLDFLLMSQGMWEPEGDQVGFVIARMAGVSEEIVDDVIDVLSGSWAYYRSVKSGGEQLYDPDSLYEEREPEEWMFRETWDAFRTEIGSYARFFSPYAEEMLNSIFGDLDGLTAYDGSPVIRVIGPEDDDAGRYVWRARKAESVEELKTILKSPEREIGPPPSEMARGGRMNAQGIPVFYGAMDVATCVSEIRPPVGSYVVVGKFDLLRSVRLLDFNALTGVYVQASYFAPDYSSRKGRIAFLQRLVDEISRPVMPKDEEREYLPTQVVAEYLANKVSPRLDGIIFPSSQTNGVGRNLVLFNHACRVKVNSQPLSDESQVALTHRFPEGDGWADNRVIVYEPVQSNSGDVESSEVTREENALTVTDLSASHGTPTLRLDLESLRVQHVRAVKYESDDHPVERIRVVTSP